MACPIRKRYRTEPTGFKMVAVDGFSSWGEEEDLDMDMHSPTDVSEDSVDVKVKPVNAPSLKSKRKCAEPRKFSEDVKKRRLQDEERSPFRPWSQETPSGYVPRGYAPPPADQDEPLSLVLREKPGDRQEKLAPPPSVLSDNHAKSMPRPLLPPSLVDRLHPDISSRPRPQDVVRLPYVEKPLSIKSETSDNYLDEDRNRAFSVESLMSTPSTSAAPTVKLSEKKRPAAPSTCASSASGVQNQQRNYKNMTRERRIEANARERTRVHTISAAFDTLRRAVPAYSHNQKLSKLSVLRIACSYILTLSRVAGLDYSEDSSEPPLADCVDHVTRTIQLEGKLRKKKDD